MVVSYEEEGMQMIKSYVSRGQIIVFKVERKQPNNFNCIKSHGSLPDETLVCLRGSATRWTVCGASRATCVLSAVFPSVAQ